MSSLVPLVATPRERVRLAGDLVAARLLFCVEEAIDKATHPIDGTFLQHHDIEYCSVSSTARTKTGHEIQLHVVDAPRLLALAVLA
jgi:4'-phosphopantetheinyl transferase EntD